MELLDTFLVSIKCTRKAKSVKEERYTNSTQINDTHSRRIWSTVYSVDCIYGKSGDPT